MPEVVVRLDVHLVALQRRAVVQQRLLEVARALVVEPELEVVRGTGLPRIRGPRFAPDRAGGSAGAAAGCGTRSRRVARRLGPAGCFRAAMPGSSVTDLGVRHRVGRGLRFRDDCAAGAGARCRGRSLDVPCDRRRRLDGRLCVDSTRDSRSAASGRRPFRSRAATTATPRRRRPRSAAEDDESPLAHAAPRRRADSRARSGRYAYGSPRGSSARRRARRGAARHGSGSQVRLTDDRRRAGPSASRYSR